MIITQAIAGKGLGPQPPSRLSFPRAWLPRVRNPGFLPLETQHLPRPAHASPNAAQGFFARQARARMTNAEPLSVSVMALL